MSAVQAVAANEAPAAGAANRQQLIAHLLKEQKRASDVPQDYSPAADALKLELASPREASAAANAHAWVSPNKSGETAETQPSPDALSLDVSNVASVGSKDAASVKVDLEAGFEPVGEEEKPSTLDLSVIGTGLAVKGDAPSSNEGVTFDATNKDFVRILHGGKEITMLLPSEMASTLEVSEALATTFNVEEEIIGLKTAALLVDEGSSTFKHHGEIVIPLSQLAELKKLLKEAKGLEGISSFDLVTTSFDMYLPVPVESEAASSTGSEESLTLSVLDGRESDLYHEAFLKVMGDESSGDLDPFEKNTLLRFGIENAAEGNVLFRAAYRVGVFMASKKHFVQGLKAIAKILLSNEDLPAMAECDASDDTSLAGAETPLTLFGLTDFVLAADELFETGDHSPQQYATLLNAIFSGHPSVLSLFRLHHDPDFIVACDGDLDLRGSLVLRDLHHLGRTLEPLQPVSDDDELLKWALKTGLHNFAADLKPESLPEEFTNIIFHMFSSGDEMILSACKEMVEADDSSPVEEVLLREYQIFLRNFAFREEALREELAEASLAKASDDVSEDGDYPDCLLTAVACLAEAGQLTEDEATSLISSYAKGNQLLKDCYDHFIEFGDSDNFFDMLKVIASTATTVETNQFDTSRLVAAEASTEAESSSYEVFEPVIASMRKQELLGSVELSALKLAALRRDAELCEALSDFRAGAMDETFFKATLLCVCDRVIARVTMEVGEE